MSGSSAVPSSRRPSFEMRSSSNSWSLNDVQSEASISPRVSVEVSGCHVLAYYQLTIVLTAPYSGEQEIAQLEQEPKAREICCGKKIVISFWSLDETTHSLIDWASWKSQQWSGDTATTRTRHFELI